MNCNLEGDCSDGILGYLPPSTDLPGDEQHLEDLGNRKLILRIGRLSFENVREGGLFRGEDSHTHGFMGLRMILHTKSTYTICTVPGSHLHVCRSCLFV